MAKSKILSALLLYPISKVYGWVVAVRNAMFNRGMLTQHSFDIPVIVVGNISMGGSGKTPHTEYIVDALASQFHIGVLSRGYKRRTRGFVMASPDSTPDAIGDEPYQIYTKFCHRGVRVAVCEDRVKGINMMRKLDPAINLIVLDDAFQHRYVKPTLAVVLMEYSRPAYADKLLPYGRLREPVTALDRADIVVVTKCPASMTPMEARIIRTNLNLMPYQRLLFSGFRYMPLVPLFPEEFPGGHGAQLSHLTRADSILAVTGVANPRPMIKYLRTYKAKVRIKRYSDHHHFSHSDMESILSKFTSMSGHTKILVTTEKDAVRLRHNPCFPAELRRCSYYLPVIVSFDEFNTETLAGDIMQMLPGKTAAYANQANS
ncbi:MAG: tetraacyldisaccharide 4'-kinase [Paramuribaculum sp.]|nr:tetraacyldisaccharide 4'-kinase [Paramuribaculum sp.]